MYRRWPNIWTFQSTLSVRRATFLRYLYRSGKVFQSTLSVRRATEALPQLIQMLPDFNPRSP